MPKAKPLSKQQIQAAMNKTMSNRAAARYLGVSYIHYKKWAKNYEPTEEGYRCGGVTAAPGVQRHEDKGGPQQHQPHRPSYHLIKIVL